jgi:hypothetical protein
VKPGTRKVRGNNKNMKLGRGWNGIESYKKMRREEKLQKSVTLM